jgi:hypothetical protein
MTYSDDANPSFKHGGLGWLSQLSRNVNISAARCRLTHQCVSHTPNYGYPRNFTLNITTRFVLSAEHFVHTTTVSGETLPRNIADPADRSPFFFA